MGTSPEIRARLTEEGSLRLFGHAVYGPHRGGLGGLAVWVRLRADGSAATVHRGRGRKRRLIGRLMSPECFEVIETW